MTVGELSERELSARIMLDVVEAGGHHEGAHAALIEVFRSLPKPGQVASFGHWQQAFKIARGQG